VNEYKPLTVGDLASISGALPSFHLPMIPLDLSTLAIIAPFAASVAAVVMRCKYQRVETHVESSWSLCLKQILMRRF